MYRFLRTIQSQFEFVFIYSSSRRNKTKKCTFLTFSVLNLCSNNNDTRRRANMSTSDVPQLVRDCRERKREEFRRFSTRLKNITAMYTCIVEKKKKKRKPARRAYVSDHMKTSYSGGGHRGARSNVSSSLRCRFSRERVDGR